MGNQFGSPIGKFAASVVMGLALASLLSGCTDFRQAMGIEKVSPDEFAIVTKAPLVMPPDYALRPPVPGAGRPIEDQQGVQAQNALFGSNATPVSDGVVTAGEFALLTSSGAGSANPHIRTVLATETNAIVQKDRSFTDQILFWQGVPTEDETVVDAAAEAERLRRNQASGRPVTEGATPTITKDRGIF